MGLRQPEAAGSIRSDFNVCLNFPLICAALALNSRKKEHCQGEGVKGEPSASVDTSLVAEGTINVQ